MTLNSIINKERVEISRRLEFMKQHVCESFNNKIVLDIGSGYQTFVSTLKKEYPYVHIDSVEPSTLRSTRGSKINDTSNINIINQFIDDKFVKENTNKYDVVVLWHVLEHIDEHNISKLLHNIKQVTKENGQIVMEVPNGKDELFKLEKYKQINYMIHHLSYFTRESLTTLLKYNNYQDFEIFHVQRYGFRNYLNWIYDLGLDLKDDMHLKCEHDYEKLWVKGKIKSENTDGILVIMRATTPQQHTYSQ
jgi:2-polyprenyl-3-methyl-5-hydroxy-6-metoxy-1,4-benzoquinol methylase